jgi:SAM-dependent methyltransferase
MGKVSRICPVCRHHDAEPVYENTMAPLGGFDMSYRVGRCRQCGFFFADTLADEQTFRSYYQSVSKYDVADEISLLDSLRIDAAVQLCKGIISYHARVVDLGCGYGALLSRLKAAGWSDLYGIDPAPNFIERARRLFGLEHIYCGTMSDAHRLLPLAQADLVCITAVLEHLPYLRSDLTELLERLRPGCRILVEVPALEHFSGADGEPFG